MPGSKSRERASRETDAPRFAHALASTSPGVPANVTGGQQQTTTRWRARDARSRTLWHAACLYEPLLGGFARRLLGVSKRESETLLRLFRNEVERHENIVRWRWRAGDVAFWDNRTTQHRAVADFGSQPRRLQRVTIAGDLPVGVDGRTSRALRGDAGAYSPAA